MDVGWQKNLGDLGGVLRLMRVPCASGVRWARPES